MYNEDLKQNQSTWALIKKLAVYNPLKSVIVLILLVFAGLAEAVGAASLMPILSIIGKMDVAQGTFITDFVDNFFGFFNLSVSLENLLAFLLFLMCLKAILLMKALNSVGYAMSDLGYDMRIRLVNALMRAKWSYFSTLPVGYITNAVGAETVRGSRTYLHLCKLCAETALVLSYLFMAVLISPPLAISAIVLGGIIMFLLKHFVSTVKQAGRDQTHHTANLTSLIADSLSALKVIKAGNREKYFTHLLDKEIAFVRTSNKKQLFGKQLLQVILEPIIVALIVIGIYSAYNYTDIALASMMTMAFMFMRMLQKLTGLQVLYQNLVADESAFWSVTNAIESAEDAKETLISKTPHKMDKVLSFKDLSYRHSEDIMIRKTLSDINASFPRNTFTAIIGPSGAGKTTLVDLILGLYPPNEGAIMIDNINLMDMDINIWRQSIGYVSQESTLLNDTVYHNITMGKDDIPETDIKKALQQAGALDFIDSLPNGLNEMVGERGQRFSGGQRQRIAIARALVTKPTLLILDEATSALDKNTARSVLESIKALSSEITIIAISHDKEVLKYADRAFKIVEGKLSEMDMQPLHKTA